MTDEQIVAGCVKGDPIAQRALYEQYARKMMSVCMRYASGATRPRTCCRTVSSRSSRRSATSAAMAPWRLGLPHHGEHRTGPPAPQQALCAHSVDLTEAEHLHAGSSSALSGMTTDELMALIQQLPDGYRTVFNLFAIEGYRTRRSPRCWAYPRTPRRASS